MYVVKKMKKGMDTASSLSTVWKILKYQFISQWKENAVMMETFINIPYYINKGRGFPNNIG